MNYLITGIAGFVGSSLARAILVRMPEARITGIDNFSFGYPDRLVDIIDRVDFIEGDLINIKELMGERSFDIIVHCAAIAPLPECQLDSYRALTQNVSITGSVTDYALSSGCRNIIFFSSGAVYEATNLYPTIEDVPISTSLIYPTSKHIAELYLEAMCRSHDLNVTAIRLFNLYGPYQDYFRKQPPLIGYLLRSLILDEEAVLFSSGNQCRDYIYISDLLELVMLSAEKMRSSDTGGKYTVVNAGSGQPISVNQIINKLESITGKSMRIKRMPAAQYWDKYAELFERKINLDREVVAREVNKHTEASVAKALREFGWSTTISLTNGLSECYKHAKSTILELKQ
jgi:UDP-glucose 4-epimerase